MENRQITRAFDFIVPFDLKRVSEDRDRRTIRVRENTTALTEAG